MHIHELSDNTFMHVLYAWTSQCRTNKKLLCLEHSHLGSRLINDECFNLQLKY